MIPWEIALAAVLLFLPSPIIVHEMWRMFRLEISDWKLANNKKLKGLYREMNNLLFCRV
jgi:hypothetical protein